MPKFKITIPGPSHWMRDAKGAIHRYAAEHPEAKDIIECSEEQAAKLAHMGLVALHDFEAKAKAVTEAARAAAEKAKKAAGVAGKDDKFVPDKKDD